MGYSKVSLARLVPAPWIQGLPRATSRNLWLLLAGALATQNIAVFHTSQSANAAVLAILVWGGALVCLEDRLDQLQPRPSRIARWLGSALVLWVLLRTRKARARGSKASRTAPANKVMDKTSTTIKPKAENRFHQTKGSRDISLRAVLIMVPKLLVLGSTPTPT